MKTKLLMKFSGLVIFGTLVLSALSFATPTVRAYGNAQIQWVFAMSNMGCVDPFYVQVTFINYDPSTLWVGLSFMDRNGNIYNVAPHDVSFQGTGVGMTTFVYSINGVTTSEDDWFKQALDYRGMQYAVALWQGYDGNDMYGWIDSRGWITVPGC
ncbi:MAG: hypothetical protein WCC94_02295 [Candidatus Bathyarchaeia archaeon]